MRVAIAWPVGGGGMMQSEFARDARGERALRMRSRRGRIKRTARQVPFAMLLLAWGLACQSRPVPDTPAPPAGAFWPEQAVLDFASLEGIEDRSRGGRGAEKARHYIGDALESMGLEVATWAPPEPEEKTSEADSDAARGPLNTLVAEIPGASQDVFLLVAHYDTPLDRGTSSGRARNIDVENASGAALLLGLARALAEKPLPYTVWLAFVDGDALSPGDPRSITPDRFVGSVALAERLAERGDLDRIRLAAFFRDVANARLQVARDLHSHRAFREVFFESALDLGYDAAFGAENRYVSGASGHRAFLARDLRQVVAITGQGAGVAAAGDKSREMAPPTESFRIVGEVTLEALDRIARRLERIDRFAEAPVQAREGAEDGAPGRVAEQASPADRDALEAD
jgi:hypothetical protein